MKGSAEAFVMFVYSLIVLVSAVTFVVTGIILIGRGFTRRRVGIVIASAIVFFVAAALNKPDVTTAAGLATTSNQPSVTSTPAVPPTAPIQTARSEPGVANVCLTDDDITFSGYRELKLPATLVLDDDGPLTAGHKDDPSSWRYEPTMQHAALKTLDPIILTKEKRCAEVKVEMWVGTLKTERTATASDNHVFAMSDVVDYRVPEQRPPVEIGKLIDDISVKAVLLTDVSQYSSEDVTSSDEASKAAKCLEGAQRLAAALGGGVGRQTSMVVFLGGLHTGEASYGCPMTSKEDPSLFISWDKQAKPPAATRNVIAKAANT